MDYPIGTVLQYKSAVGYSTWTVIAERGGALGRSSILLTLELTSIQSPTETRPIGRRVPISPAAIDSHIKNNFVLNVIPPCSIADIET